MHHPNQFPRRWLRISASLIIIATLSYNIMATVPAKGKDTSSVDADQNTHIVDTYDKLPITFEQNIGQFDSRARYVTRGANMTTFLTVGGAVFTLGLPQLDDSQATWKDKTVNEPQRIAAVHMTLDGANAQSTITAEGQQEGISNYFLGNDPAQWHTNVAHFSKVIYRDVYPGIDMVYYGQAGKLRYDFVVRPGADPTQITLHFAGQRALEIDSYGNLHVHVAEASLKTALHQDAPYTYQTVNGVNHEVSSQFRIDGYRVRFDLSSYDPTLPLVIDPSLVYSTFIGGTNNETANSIAVDSAGNTYITGTTASDDLFTAGSYDVEFADSTDVFVTKLNAAGNALVYSTYLGGDDGDNGFSIAVDSAGNAYVTGNTRDGNFPTTDGAYDEEYNDTDNFDGFVAKLNAAGNDLIYSTYLGGSKYDLGVGIAVDNNGDAYVAGVTFSSSEGTYPFPHTDDAYDTSHSGLFLSGFVTELNALGSNLVYSTFLGLNYEVHLTGITIDNVGSAYVVGYTGDPDFPATSGAYDIGHNGGYDVFVTKLNAAGNDLVYFTYLGGSANDYSSGIAIDSAGNVYVAGSTASSGSGIEPLPAAFPTTPNAYDTSFNGSSGGYNGFIAKLNSAGSSLRYSTFLGGSSTSLYSEGPYDIAVDNMGNVYATGTTTTDDFPTTLDAYYASRIGLKDSFVTKLSMVGHGLNDLVYSTYLGSSRDDVGYSIALDNGSNAYVTGVTEYGDFPAPSGAYDTSFNGVNDAFITKFALATEPAGDKIGGVRALNSLGTLLFGLRNTLTSGVADYSIVYGLSTDQGLAGDWNGDGIDTIGYYRPSTTILSLTDQIASEIISSGLPPTTTYSFGLGIVGDSPIVGDWDNDGDDSIGVYRASNRTFYLRNTLNAGYANLTITTLFAQAGDVPVIGDWDCNGVDNVGVFRPSNRTFYLTNQSMSGTVTTPDLALLYGIANDLPMIGDWDGDSCSNLGIFRNGIVGLRNSLTAGVADLTFLYGTTGDKPLVGRWVASNGVNSMFEFAPPFNPKQ